MSTIGAVRESEIHPGRHEAPWSPNTNESDTDHVGDHRKFVRP